MGKAIYVGATKAKLVEELRRVLSEVEASGDGDGQVDVTLYGQMNDSRQGEGRVVFSNDDMENRPEVADRVILDVEEE